MKSICVTTADVLVSVTVKTFAVKIKAEDRFLIIFPSVQPSLLAALLRTTRT